MITLTLPLPPTINHYYGQRPRGGRYIKPAGVTFRLAVAEVVARAAHRPITGRVSLFVAIHPADRRKQDIDNRAKALQDALTNSGIWLDDEQIDELHLIRRPIIKGGQVVVVINEIDSTPSRQPQLTEKGHRHA